MRRLLAALGATGFVACAAFTSGKTNDAPAKPDDAGAISDASAPLEAEAAVDGGRFCSEPSVLCADFDGENTGGWGIASNVVDDDFADVGGSLAPGSGGDPGAALIATLPPGSGEADVTRRLLSPDLVDFELEGDVYVEPPPPGRAGFADGNGITVFKLSYGGQSGNPTIEIRLLPSDPQNAQVLAFFRTTGNAEISTVDGPTMAFGTWVHMKIDARLVGESGTGISTVTVGGASVKSIALPLAKAQTITNPPAIRSTIGIQRQDIGNSYVLMTARYDNVQGRPLE